MSFSKSGQDLYDRGHALYYVLQVLLCTYAAGYICSLVLIQNAYPTHTYTKNNNNGVLYSTRYTSLYWGALMFSAMRFMVIVFVCMAILFRKTTCCGCKFNCCTGIWISLLIILVAFDFLTLSILSNHYAKCNGLDQVDNPCNDKKWCCAEEIYNNPANLCGNTCSAFIGYDTLVADVDFIWLFSLTVAFCAFDLVFMLIPIGLWLYGGLQADVMDDREETNDVYAKAPSPSPMGAGIGGVHNRRLVAK